MILTPAAMAGASSECESAVACEQCLVCHGKNDGKVKWLLCLKCRKGGHTTCTRMAGVKANASDINWVCDPCALEIKNEAQIRTEVNVMKSEIVEIKNMLKAINLPQNVHASVMAALPALTDGVASAVEGAVSSQSERELNDDTGSSWATLVSRGRKRGVQENSKNLLILKANGTDTAADLKSEVENALSGIQISDSKFTTKGNIVMNFESKERRNEAQHKLQAVKNATVFSAKQMDPKIMICNVAEQENEGSIVNLLIERNNLEVIDDIEDKLKIVLKKPAAGGTVHYIIKCTPEVRAHVRKMGDKVKLKWGVYRVLDRYHPFMCYHCLKFGHKSENCQSKAKGQGPHCYKCAGNHEGRTCLSEVRKCFNCAEVKRQDNHSVSGLSCPIFAAEVNRIRLSTDHGL